MEHKSVEEQDFGDGVFAKVVFDNKVIVNTHPAKERKEIHTNSKEKTA